MKRIVIDQDTWESGHDERQKEWMPMINALMIKDVNRFSEDIEILVIYRREKSFELILIKKENISHLGLEAFIQKADYFISNELLQEIEVNPDVVIRLRIEYAGLNDFMMEYIDIVRQLAKSDQIHRLETLDMAKKVVHDKAGRFLKKSSLDLGMNLETSRRLFSLLLALKIDTTRILGVHGHRRIR